MVEEQRKLKVLLVAFQCAPEGGSVAMIGWHWVKYLEPHVDLHLVTHIRHKLELEPVLPPTVTATFVDTEWFSRPFYNMATRFFGSSQHLLFMVANIDFLYFSHKAMRELRPLHKEQGFDICHVVTPLTPVAPHRFGTLGPPTLLGPLNGGLPFLKGFPDISTEERVWLYRLRTLVRLINRCYGTFRHAKVIFSATRSNDHGLGHKLASKAYRMCENGVDEVAEHVPPFPALPPLAPLELLYVGRLIPIKGLRMLLDAIQGVTGVHLTLVGDGPMLPQLLEKVKIMGLQDRVTFRGYLESKQLTEIYRQCHLNVLPSVRESGGATILEAMAQGRPSLALNKGGPSEYITPQTGILLDCHNTAQVTSDLQTAIKELREDPDVLVQMAEACLKRVRLHYTWAAKSEEVLKVYRRVANNQEI